MIRHDQARELSAAALDFPLAPAEADALAQHLAGCGECRAFSAAVGRDAGAIVELPAVHAPDALRNATLWHATRPAARGHGLRLIGLLAAVLVLVVGGGALAGSLLRDNQEVVLDPSSSATLGPDDEVVETPTSSPSPTATATATSTSTASPTAIPTSSPTPAPTAAQLQDLDYDRWVMALGSVNLRSQPSTGALVVRVLPAGDPVYVTDELRVIADGYTWYRAVTLADEVGWVAAHGESRQLLSSDGLTRVLRVCRTPAASPLEGDGAPFPGREERLLLGSLPLQSHLFSDAALDVADLAYGDGEADVCVDLRVEDGWIVSAEISADFSTCGSVVVAMGAWYLEYPDPGEPSGARIGGIGQAILGVFPPYHQSEPGDLLLLAAGGETGERTGHEVCIDVAASGGLNDTEVDTLLSADACVSVTSVTETAIGLRGVAPFSTDDYSFGVGPESSVDPQIDEGETLAISIRVEGGANALASVSVASLPGCG